MKGTSREEWLEMQKEKHNKRDIFSETLSAFSFVVNSVWVIIAILVIALFLVVWIRGNDIKAMWVENSKTYELSTSMFSNKRPSANKPAVVKTVDLGIMDIHKRRDRQKNMSKSDLLIYYLVQNEDLVLKCKVRGKYRKIQPADLFSIERGRYYFSIGRSSTNCFLRASVF